MAELLLHMVTLTHGPETCPAARPDLQEKCGVRLAALPGEAPNHGAEVRGRWADPPGHVFYFLVAAPNAHAVASLIGGLELSHWNTVEVRPVIDMAG